VKSTIMDENENIDELDMDDERYNMDDISLKNCI
jgi:hypothetical protein